MYEVVLTCMYEGVCTSASGSIRIPETYLSVHRSGQDPTISQMSNRGDPIGVTVSLAVHGDGPFFCGHTTTNTTTTPTTTTTTVIYPYRYSIQGMI